MRTIEVSDRVINDYIGSISVLLVTATDLESTELIKSLQPLPNEIGIIQIFSGNQTYYLGVLGIYGVVVVQSEMGAVGRNSSLITTLRAIEAWKPKAIIMVGIAFGIDSQKQHIGDVIVSSHIIPYENAKIGKEQVFRSELPQASTLLINRVRQIRDWQFLVSREIYAKLFIGPILSGEKLIDNKQFLVSLTNTFRNAIGGEMESAGIYAAADEKKTDWIIIKGICDFADGNKSTNKNEYQTLAIKSAVSFTEKVLSIRFGYSELGFRPLRDTEQSEPTTSKTTKLEDLLALFDSIELQSESNAGDTFKVVARQIVQTELNDKLKNDAAILQMLVPDAILSTFEKRIATCWQMYNEVMASDGEYLSSELDKSAVALQNCICRELSRLLQVNGAIPNGQMLNYWNTYRCDLKY